MRSAWHFLCSHGFVVTRKTKYYLPSNCKPYQYNLLVHMCIMYLHLQWNGMGIYFFKLVNFLTKKSSLLMIFHRISEVERKGLWVCCFFHMSPFEVYTQVQYFLLQLLYFCGFPIQCINTPDSPISLFYKRILFFLCITQPVTS